MKLRIPERNRDVRRYVLRRRVLQLLGYALLVLAFGLGACGYNQAHQTYPPEKRILGWRLAVWMLAAVLLGFLLLRVWRIFTLRTVEGTIERSRLSHTYTSSSDPGVTSPVNYDFRLHSTLTLRDGKGRRRYLSFEQKPGFYLYYYPGTHCCRLSGLPYPICDPARRASPERRHTEGARDPFDDLSGGYVCVACGLLNPSAEGYCARCGLSIIDPRDLWGDREERF